METLQNIFQAEIIQKLGWTLVHFVWQATAIGLILAIVLKLLHKSSANLRYIIACIALALIVVMPAVTIRMIDASLETIEPIKRAAIDSPKAGADTQIAIEIPQIEPTTQIAATPRISLKNKFIETIEPVLPYSVAGWLAGVFGLSLWHLGGWRQLQKLRKKMLKNAPYEIAATAKKLSRALGIEKAVSIAESALVEVPTVIGHLRPIILLPASALTGLSVQQIEAILAHELAHIKRHDYLVNILQTVVEILGFYHPAVWWVSHKIRAERENCCDDIAVSLCSDKVCYARALTTMEEIRAGQPTLAVAASGGNLFDRIRRLLGKESASEGKLSWLPSVITILLIVALLIPTALALSGNNKEQVGKRVDITARDFKIVTNDRGINNLVVSIKNESDVAIPEFKIRYYMDNVKNNIDEAGNAHSGWHNAGPIESGQAWNERTRDFHLPDGQYEFTVVLDYDNTIFETDENNNIASIKVAIKGGQIKISEPTGQIESFEQQLKEPVTVHIDKSPDGDNLTIQYAVIAICKAASVPYNWDKSTELANPERKQYIEPVNIENKIASQAITDILVPVGLLYSVDVDGVYLYKAEHFAKMQSKLEILNIELEPIAQGKNILYANVKNTSDTEQLFAIHIYTRSVDYGSQGIGWGTRFFEKIKPNETKRVRFAYKIQGPVTENTYVRVKFYNPATEKDYNYDKPFNVRLYESSDLPKPGKLIESPKKVTDQQMVDEIFNIFHSIQANIKNGDYESAWNCFTNDYQQSEYQSGGLKKFKLHMEPKHNLDAAFSWNKDAFVKLKIKNLKADFHNHKQPPAILEAEYKNESWKLYFIYAQRDNKWKIDDIVGYRPAILDIQQQDSISANTVK